ncbi:metal-dependent hydrolase [Rugamonas sp. CCM 8940]|uniref:metal-dependent hydrolase n=1 Tax=Rugamonas sp. CCM 8940 TaxID=2765359 RepID=UPI0018F7AC0A|nr:metal-dependent hydrolase [Rugamonas sp. CCM 8940]MBJ7311323.1 metal-dependent hydrolase [Rugamonas sp. CCM 8940]
MDNITHSLIGLGAGELIHRSLRPEPDAASQRTRHRLLLAACALASNFPDLDLFLTKLLPVPLGYLLNHRGHTHTLLFALPQALLLLALLWSLWPAARALLRRSGAARFGLAASTLLGLGLHLLMDFTNSYGIHPFYPFDGRWFYGDMVFIVEPLFWVAFGVPLAWLTAARTTRALGLGLLAAALLFFGWKGFLAWSALAALLAVAAAMIALQRRDGARGRGALLLALVLSGVFVGGQGLGSAVGAQRIRAALLQLDPAARTVDVAMTAFPSQPLCWNFVSVEVDEAADRYRMRRGVLSLAPQWLAPQACPSGLLDRVAAQAPARPLTAALTQYDERSASLSALRGLRRDSCYVDAWLRFARAPALVDGELSDYRFAGTPNGNFSALRIADSRQAACPQNVPRWDYPRADLLTPSATVAPAPAPAPTPTPTLVSAGGRPP